MQHMAKLHRHINRHLAKWAWHFDAYTTWLSVALMLPLCLWMGHQINNCQYAIDSAATQQTVRNYAGDGDGDADADVALAANVTMSKTAPSESDKCFYNCQMALATLLQRNNDDVGDDDDDDDDRANDDGDDDDDANAGVDLTAAADRATLKRQHQQLSATLAKVGAASQPDQRLLMTCPTLAAAAAATC